MYLLQSMSVFRSPSLSKRCYYPLIYVTCMHFVNGSDIFAFTVVREISVIVMANVNWKVTGNKETAQFLQGWLPYSWLNDESKDERYNKKAQITLQMCVEILLLACQCNRQS